MDRRYSRSYNPQANPIGYLRNLGQGWYDAVTDLPDIFSAARARNALRVDTSSVPDFVPLDQIPAYIEAANALKREARNTLASIEEKENRRTVGKYPGGEGYEAGNALSYAFDPVGDLAGGPIGPLLGNVIPAATVFFRRTKGKSPFNSVDWAMFADSHDDLGIYGDYLHTFHPERSGARIANASDREFQREIAKSLLKDKDMLRTWGVDPRAAARDANPENIVISAGLWDNPDFVQNVYENVLGPKGIDAVITNDGAVVFNEGMIRKRGKVSAR